MQLASDPAARRASGHSRSRKLSIASSEELKALALVDYENVRLGAESRFANSEAVDGRIRDRGRFDFHPWKLGEVICDVLSRKRNGRNVKLVEVRVYCAESLDLDVQRRQRSQRDAWRYPPAADLDAVRVVSVNPPQQRAHNDHPTKAERDGNVEKEVDTTMAVDLVVAAATRSNEFDVAILFSHDSDLVPAVEDALEREGEGPSLEVHCVGWVWEGEDLGDVAKEKTPLPFRLPEGRSHYLTAHDYAAVADDHSYRSPLDELRECQEDQSVVFGRTVSATRDGLEVEVKGTRGFVSAGDVEATDYGPAIERVRKLQGNRPLQLAVREIQPQRRAHDSRRVRLAERTATQGGGPELRPGSVSRGRVALTLECGILVDCGEFNCFVPYDELRWDDGYNVADVFTPDQAVDVLCYRHGRRAHFSIRRASDQVGLRLDELHEGDVLTGRRVCRERPGRELSVDLGGLSGFLPEPAMSSPHDTNPKQGLSMGRRLDVRVAKVDRVNRQVRLALPGSSAKRYADGQTVTGIVTRIEDYGAFVKIDGEVDGLVHVSELADYRVRRVSDVVHEGDILPLKVLPRRDGQSGLRLSLKAARAEAEESGWGFDADGRIERVPEEIAAELGNVGSEQSSDTLSAAEREAQSSGSPLPSSQTTAMEEAYRRATTAAPSRTPRISQRRHRATLRRQKALASSSGPKVGDSRLGRVRGITERDVVFDVDGETWLVARKRLSLRRRAVMPQWYVERVCSIDETIDVRVTSINPQTGEVRGSIRDELVLRWDRATEELEEGHVVAGRVTEAARNVFVHIKGPVEGRMRKAELTAARIRSARELVQEGDIIPVKILKIDRELRRIDLSLKSAREEAEASGWAFDRDGRVTRLPDDLAAELGIEQGD